MTSSLVPVPSVRAVEPIGKSAGDQPEPNPHSKPEFIRVRCLRCSTVIEFAYEVDLKAIGRILADCPEHKLNPVGRLLIKAIRGRGCYQ